MTYIYTYLLVEGKVVINIGTYIKW